MATVRRTDLAAAQAAFGEQREVVRSRKEALRESRREFAERAGSASPRRRRRRLLRRRNSAGLRNELTALDLQKQGNVVRLEKLSAEKIQLEEERTRLETRLHEFAVNVQAQKLNAQTQRGTVEERQKRLAEMHGRIGSPAQELDQISAAAGGKTFAARRAGAIAGRP